LTSCNGLVHLANMSRMFRFANKTADLLLRLVIVLSLAGYSLSGASAAMHPDLRAQAAQSVSHHEVEHEGDQHHQTDAKRIKDTCCQDYCAVSAIQCFGTALKHPRAESLREFVNDAYQVGRPPRIDLPPNI